MKGSIRFDNEINVEVAVDPSQDEGAKLLSAVNLVDGQELGSGGGDFSTAEVTINNEKSLNYNLPYLTEHEGVEYIQCYDSRSGTFNVVLYKGNAVLSFVEEVSVLYTGNVTELSAGFVYLITGDATITVTSI